MSTDTIQYTNHAVGFVDILGFSQFMQLITSIILLCACIGCTRFETPRPVNWPTPTDNTCRNIEGQYRDPQVLRGRIIIDTQTTHEEYGGTVDDAWEIFFGFRGAGNAQNPTEKNKVFDLSFDINKNLTINYSINSSLVAKKTYSKDDYKCSHGILVFDSHVDDSVDFDKGSRGSSITSVEVIRSDDKLYIKRVLLMKSYFSMVPVRSYLTEWQIFPTITNTSHR